MRAADLDRIALVMVLAGTAFASACGDALGTGRRLRFEAVGPTVVAGTEFTVNVEIVSGNGRRETAADDEITIALEDPGALVIIGETTVTAVNGLATFAVAIEQTGAALRFVAEAGNLVAFSGVFEIEAGPPSPDASSISPGPGTIPPNGVEFTFLFVDAYGNAIANADIALSSSLAGSAFTPASGQTSLTGEFAAVLNSSAEGSANITATVQGVPVSVADPYTLVELCPGPVAMAFPGTVDGVQPCGAYSPGVRAPSVYEFTTAGGGAAFTITSTFQPLFQVKLNATSNDVLITTDVTPWTEEWLLPAGTYLYSVSSVSAPGTFTLTGAAVAANTGNFYRNLAAEGTYTGQQLAPGDLQFTDDQSYYDGFAFRSSSPCTLTLRSATYAPYLSVRNRNAETQRVTSDVTTPAGVDAVIQLAACSTGNNDPVLVLAGSFAPGSTGAYTLIVDVSEGVALRNRAGLNRNVFAPTTAAPVGPRGVIRGTALRKKP